MRLDASIDDLSGEIPEMRRPLGHRESARVDEVYRKSIALPSPILVFSLRPASEVVVEIKARRVGSIAIIAEGALDGYSIEVFLVALVAIAWKMYGALSIRKTTRLGVVATVPKHLDCLSQNKGFRRV